MKRRGGHPADQSTSTGHKQQRSLEKAANAVQRNTIVKQIEACLWRILDQFPNAEDKHLVVATDGNGSNCCLAIPVIDAIRRHEQLQDNVHLRILSTIPEEGVKAAPARRYLQQARRSTPSLQVEFIECKCRIEHVVQYLCGAKLTFHLQ